MDSVAISEAGLAARSILIDAARCWRSARDDGRAVQPPLARMLCARDCAVLAPVLDSLCAFYEAALGRSIVTGAGPTPTRDEEVLVALIEGSMPRACLMCPAGAATALDCALCSTRIMLALAVGTRH